MNYAKYSKLGYITSFSAINYVQALLSAAVTFMLAHYLTLEDFAAYRFGLICLGIVSVIGLFSAEKSLLIEIMHTKRTEAALRAFWVLRAAIAVVIAVLVNAWIWLRYDDGSIAIALIFSIAGVLVALRSPGWFDFAGRLRQHAVLLLGERAAFALAMGGLILMLGGSVPVMWIGAVLIATSVLMIVAELKVILPNIDRTAFRAGGIRLADLYVRYHWIWYLAISNLMMTSIGQLVLDDRAQRVELAYLGLAMQFANILRLFMQQITRLRGAGIAQVTDGSTPPAKVRKSFVRDIVRILALGAVFALVYGLVAQVLIIQFFGERYAPSVPICWVLSAWTLVLGVGLLTNRYVIGLRLQQYAFGFGLFWGVTSLVLIFQLAGTAGAFGYACILLGCHAGSVLCQIATVLIALSRRGRDAMPL